MMLELTNRHSKAFTFTCFDATNSDMVLVKEIPFYSLCEHHMLPFFGKAYVAYIPYKKILGLSKIPRLVDYCATGLLTQEQITEQITRFMMENDNLHPYGAAACLKARHLCMEMRGVSKPEVITETLSFRGCMTNSSYQRDFLQAIK